MKSFKNYASNLITGNYEIECDFSMVATQNQILTMYHGLDYINFKGKRNNGYLEINTNYNIEELLDGNPNCTQSIDQLCHPWLEELYRVDTNGTGGQFSFCECLRYSTWFDQDHG